MTKGSEIDAKETKNVNSVTPFPEGERNFMFRFNRLLNPSKLVRKMLSIGMENAINTCKFLLKEWKEMIKDSEDAVMTTQEACHYLRISRPTYLKHLYLGKIRGVKVGKGWKVLRSELDSFLKGDYQSSYHPPFSSSLSE